MTDPNPTSSEETTDNGTPKPSPPAPTGSGSGDQKSGGNQEAARWRVRSRELEQSLASVDERTANVQRQNVELMIQHDAELPFLHRSADLWDVLGTDIADLRDDDGNVDHEKLTAALEEAKTERPYLFGDRPAPDPLAALLSRQRPNDGVARANQVDTLRKLLTPSP